MIRRTLLLFVCLPGGLTALDKQLNVKAPMRDGVKLSANLFRPAAQGKFPLILVRTPYNKGADIAAGYRMFVENGYAVMVQDVRGKYGSEGAFDVWRQEAPDGEDTLKWIATQPWTDGKVGMIGGSYVGIVQWKAALSGHPSLKAIFPAVSGWDDYRDRFYSPGGAMKLGHRLSWMADNLRAANFTAPPFSKYVTHLPVGTADTAATGQRSELLYQPAMKHPAYDAFWKAMSTQPAL